MVVNFKVHEISQGTRKLTRISTLIKKIVESNTLLTKICGKYTYIFFYFLIINVCNIWMATCKTWMC